eukprot:UN26191
MVYHLEQWAAKIRNLNDSLFSCSPVSKTRLKKWILCVLIGILTGCVAFFITRCSDSLTKFNLSLTRRSLKKSFTRGFAIFGVINLGFVFIATCLVVLVEPAASGSGIPEVKAYLNGSWKRHIFNIRTSMVKIVGIIFAVSALLCIGKEGPMVHAGAILAQGLSRGRTGTLGYDCNIFQEFRTDRETRGFYIL